MWKTTWLGTLKCLTTKGLSVEFFAVRRVTAAVAKYNLKWLLKQQESMRKTGQKDTRGLCV